MKKILVNVSTSLVVAFVALTLVSTGITTGVNAHEAKKSFKNKIAIEKTDKDIYRKTQKSIYGPNSVKYNGPMEPIIINGIY